MYTPKGAAYLFQSDLFQSLMLQWEIGLNPFALRLRCLTIIWQQLSSSSNINQLNTCRSIMGFTNAYSQSSSQGVFQGSIILRHFLAKKFNHQHVNFQVRYINRIQTLPLVGLGHLQAQWWLKIRKMFFHISLAMISYNYISFARWQISTNLRLFFEFFDKLNLVKTLLKPPISLCGRRRH